MFQDGSKWKNFKLDQSQMDCFRRDGFLLNVPVLTEEQCDRILEDYRYFMVTFRNINSSQCLPILSFVYFFNMYVKFESNDGYFFVVSKLLLFHRYLSI